MTKNFLLIPNLKRNSLPSVRTAIDFLRSNECNVFCQKEEATILNIDIIDDIQKIDYILVFGGDGTMLRAVKKYIEYGIPFAGINTGHLGYLADIEPDKIENALKLILENDFSIERRAVLAVKFDKKKIYAVNEVALQRTSAHILGVEIAVGGQRIEPLQADGVLVATPTGSTAYNLSAGGPILMPTAKTCVVTPICAHSLTARPIVLGEKDILTLTVKDENEAVVNIDGEQVGELNNKKSIDIAVSKKTFSLLRFSPDSFFSILRNKLSTWEN